MAGRDALGIEVLGERLDEAKIAGKMHACGRDGHSWVLLGAARVASTVRIGAEGDVLTNVLGLVERGELLYLVGSLVGGLSIGRL